MECDRIEISTIGWVFNVWLVACMVLFHVATYYVEPYKKEISATG